MDDLVTLGECRHCIVACGQCPDVIRSTIRMSEGRARDLQAAIDEYVEASIHEADVAATEDVGAFPGPEQIKAKTRVNMAYERLFALSHRGRTSL